MPGGSLHIEGEHARDGHHNSGRDKENVTPASPSPSYTEVMAHLAAAPPPSPTRKPAETREEVKAESPLSAMCLNAEANHGYETPPAPKRRLLPRSPLKDYDPYGRFERNESKDALVFNGSPDLISAVGPFIDSQRGTTYTGNVFFEPSEGSPPEVVYTKTPTRTPLHRDGVQIRAEVDGKSCEMALFRSESSGGKKRLRKPPKLRKKLDFDRLLEDEKIEVQLQHKLQIVGPVIIDKARLEDWRGVKRSRSQNAVMKNIGATDMLAYFLGVDPEEEFEWLHAVAHHHGGEDGEEPQDSHNLFGGTYHCNTSMISIEDIIDHLLMTNKVPYLKVQVIAHLVKNPRPEIPIKSIPFAQKIEYRIFMPDNDKDYISVEFDGFNSRRPHVVQRDYIYAVIKHFFTRNNVRDVVVGAGAGAGAEVLVQDSGLEYRLA